MKLYVFRLMSVLTLIFVLTACSTNTNNNSEEENAAKESRNEEEITLTLGHYRVTDNPIDQLFVKTVEQFKEDHPEVTIEENAVAHDPYRTRMTTLSASGELPDIFMANGSMLIDYISKDYVASWNDILDEDTEWRDGFINNAFDDFSSDDNIYGIPVQMQGVHTIYYNQKIFEEVGINEFPKTYSAFQDAIQTIKEADYTPIVMGNKPNWPFGSTFFSTFADRITGTEWFAGLETGESKFTDPEFIQVLEETKELAESGAFNPDINSIDPEQAANVYFTEEAAMMVIGPWGIRDYFLNAPDEVKENTHLALLPEIDGGKGKANAVAGGGGWSYAINGQLEGKKKELAIEFVKSLTNDAFAQGMLENNGMPMRNLDTTDAELTPLQEEYFSMMDGIEYTPVYDIRLEPAVVESLYRGLQDMLIGGVTPEQLAENVQSNVGN
ncbi:extracellular solute-binding protein [Gracilibacillus salinarum]|uniref:Extracellular solute-binding protein n=1 Tax=Gracilibacillus salinarum TaxID=2932255 RepID=A0ABY4GS67_9BACI|nr:extracellular solute-binding protein [Gracilibacillus salinarum]UOQ86985.1 extracellular solute-binding protein [Gracilibacillus salinarum]